ncbi:hypothetical protein UFOVP189_49 [uncultured Caudovirales phage]|uniref:DNA transfer protein n=1 Tax=uncultured Caudovirales phage TaxID=2100421 RepID=A0A6J7WGG9_9CAUD|nr:hypothetical protein UFOVP189_49 [uncultured Caudovirales phage]
MAGIGAFLNQGTSTPEERLAFLQAYGLDRSGLGIPGLLGGTPDSMEAQPQPSSYGNFGGMFGGASALDEYMTPEQKAQLQNQGLMSAAMQLLASSGPSRTPVGLGQALGEAYGAGQKGYTAAQQNLLQSIGMKQKMEEAKATKDMQANVAGFLSQPVPEGVDPKEFKAQQYMKLADVYAARNPEQASKFFDMAQKLMPAKEATPDDIKKLNALGLPVTIENLQKLHPTAVGQEPEQIRTLKALNLPVTLENLQSLKQEASPAEIRILRETGQPVTLENVMKIRQSGAGGTNVSVNTGEKGFKNEFDLKKEFNNEPIYKEFQSMKSAFSQIQESLKKANPIGDVAAATKIMKLLDPGSVVRESELGIAMAATGKMDRLKNYVDMWKTGTLLTPTQRNEFNALANELFAASAKSYNDKRNEYAGFGGKYGIDASQALGAPVPVPVYAPPVATGASNRPPLSSIIKPRGVQ